MTVRVYVPATLRGLRRLVAVGAVGPAPFLAHAVTDTVRRELAGGTEEDWEHAAATAASMASVALLAQEQSQPATHASGGAPCRVVLALDVPAVHPAGEGGPWHAVEQDPTVVRVEQAVPSRRLAAVLADAPSAARTVAAARDAVATGGADAERLLERCLDHELGWWATQEVAVLLGTEEAGGSA